MILTAEPTMWGIATSSHLESVLLVIIDMTLINPTKLKIGQKINFENAKGIIVQPDDNKKETETSNSGDK